MKTPVLPAAAPVVAALAALGLAAGLILWLPPYRANRVWVRQAFRVPILLYHGIGDPQPGARGLRRDLACPREDFRAHLHYLAESGYTCVTFSDLEAALRETARLPARPVVLTFDDGLDSHWDAFADLVASGMKGVFFVVSGLLDHPGHLMRWQVRTLTRAGMEVGSHSVTHPDFRRLSAADRERELSESKRDLEALTGARVVAFAYPGGSYDGGCFEILARAGYSFARTTAPGIAEVSLHAYELDAVPIWNGTNARRLAGKLQRLQARLPAP